MIEVGEEGDEERKEKRRSGFDLPCVASQKATQNLKIATHIQNCVIVFAAQKTLGFTLCHNTKCYTNFGNCCSNPKVFNSFCYTQKGQKEEEGKEKERNRGMGMGMIFDHLTFPSNESISSRSTIWTWSTVGTRDALHSLKAW